MAKPASQLWKPAGWPGSRNQPLLVRNQEDILLQCRHGKNPSCSLLFPALCKKCLQCGHANQDTQKKIIQSQRFWKQKIVKFFCKRTNNIHKFEGCLLRGQVSSNGFEVFNGCIVEPWILLVHLQKKKKKNFRIFGFQKTLWLDTLHPNAGSSSRTVIWYKSKLQENFAVSCSLVTVIEMTDVQLAYWVTKSRGKDNKNLSFCRDGNIHWGTSSTQNFR